MISGKPLNFYEAIVEFINEVHKSVNALGYWLPEWITKRALDVFNVGFEFNQFIISHDLLLRFDAIIAQAHSHNEPRQLKETQYDRHQPPGRDW